MDGIEHAEIGFGQDGVRDGLAIIDTDKNEPGEEQDGGDESGFDDADDGGAGVFIQKKQPSVNEMAAI